MILLHSRNRAPGIIRALQKYRIPTQVDQYGLLLEQDVVKPLISVLELLVRPDSRHAQASIALSPIMNCSESEVHQKMQSQFTANGWTSMMEFCSNERKRNLIGELDQLNQRGARYEVLESILDHSDLLFTYPEPHERQHAEAFLTLVRMIGSECGDEIAANLFKNQRIDEFGKFWSKGFLVFVKWFCEIDDYSQIQGSRIQSGDRIWFIRSW